MERNKYKITNILESKALALADRTKAKALDSNSIYEVAMSNKTYKIQFQINSYWQAGTGYGGGALSDSLVNKDINGLPFLPGRTIKGLMRDAVYRIQEWGHIPKETTHSFFGSLPLEKGITRLETESGALAISDAILPEEITTWLSHPDNTEIRQGLFKQISSTAINPETGSAKNQSLRAIEVSIPLTLTATLTVLNEQTLNQLDWGTGKTWKEGLKSSLKLIRAVGASRNRGLGRVIVTFKG